MNECTTDMSRFGHREIRMARDLMDAWAEQGLPDEMGDGVTVMFNPMSGCVFLTDEDYNVAMMNDDKLELWHTCPQCGHEGFAEDMQHGEDDEDCRRYLVDIGISEDAA